MNPEDMRKGERGKDKQSSYIPRDNSTTPYIQQKSNIAALDQTHSPDTPDFAI